VLFGRLVPSTLAINGDMLPLVSSSITLSQVFVEASSIKGLSVMLIPVAAHDLNSAPLFDGSVSV
jgi:hypothetical protein